MEKTNFDKIIDYLNDCELPVYDSNIARMTDIPIEKVKGILNEYYGFVQVKRGKGKTKKMMIQIMVLGFWIEKF